MDANLRVVTQLPFRELWRDDGLSTTTRGKSLTLDEVREFACNSMLGPRVLPEDDSNDENRRSRNFALFLRQNRGQLVLWGCFAS